MDLWIYGSMDLWIYGHETLRNEVNFPAPLEGTSHWRARTGSGLFGQSGDGEMSTLEQ